MTTIVEKLTKIKNALTAIKNSIISKGQTPTGDITTYATAIDNIESGGTTINNQDKTITSNGSYTADEGYTGLGTVTVNVEGDSSDFTGIPREVNSSGVMGYPSENFTLTFPSNVYTLNNFSFQFAFNNCTTLTGIDFSNIHTLGVTSMQAAFSRCTGLTSVEFTNVHTIYYYALVDAFQGCENLTTLSFPSLSNPVQNVGTGPFENMLYRVTGCTVHFPSNIENIIGSWSEVTSGFGGTNTVILFDLPPVFPPSGGAGN